MKKYYIFWFLLYLCIVNRIDKKIMIDYIVNTENYIDIYIKNNKLKFINSLIFKIIFIILFFLYPIIGFINNLKNSNCNLNLFLKKLQHPISIFDPNLTTYNIYLSTNSNDLYLSKLDSYWKIFFTKYKIPHQIKIKNYQNFIKIQTTNNKILKISHNELEFKKNNKLIDNRNNNIIHNDLISNQQIKNLKNICLSLHKKFNNKFKIIEWTIIIEPNKFYFVNGNIYHNLIDTKSKNYNKDFINTMKVLVNTTPSNN
jgi:hypothetical protein